MTINNYLRYVFCRMLALGVLVLFHCTITYGQWENVWVFGQSAGLDFSATPPIPYQTAITGFGEACASVCDTEGYLLFYTEGSRVWDRNDNLMPNGTGLSPVVCDNVETSSAAQGTLIVPLPDAPHLYYIISLTAQECGSDKGCLFYSLVDMTLNEGNGAVVEGYKGILVDTGLTERMTAVSGNDCNMWLLSVSQANELRAYEISVSGIVSPPIVTVLGIQDPGMVGKMVVSPNRLWLTITDYSTAYPVKLCSFDPSSGTAATPMLLGLAVNTYGACFSPDNSKLYINEAASEGSIIYQYEVSSGEEAVITSSKTLVGPVSLPISDIKRGPDQKLYYPYQASPVGVYMGAIHEPNQAGIACNNESEYISFPPTMLVRAGLPNIIPFISGGDDTLTNTQTDTSCFASEVVLSAPDSAVNILWSNGSVALELTVSASGTYWVQYNFPHSQCTLRVDTFNITLVNPELPELVTLASCANASNGKAYMNGPYVNNFSYAWKDASGILLSQESILEGVAPGDYIVSIYTVGDCMTSINFSITEIDEPVAFDVDTIVCEEESVSFINTSAVYYTDFTWQFGTGDSSNLSSPHYTYATSGQYEVQLIGRGIQCRDTATVRITVDAPEAGYQFNLEPKEICTGEAVGLSIDITGEDNTLDGLYWYFGDGSYLQINDGNQQINHAYDSAGIMPVTLTAKFRACADVSFTDTVRVYALPIVDLGQDTSLCLDGRPIMLHNLAFAPGTSHQYSWNTGDTTAALRIQQPGRYSLKVITEPIGCTATDEIEVVKDCYADIPNAFTPNGDGDNDYFFPRTQLSNGVTNFKMQVFNRWGQLIFETTKLDGRGWDGRFNGQDQPMGVYLYLIDVGYSNGRQEAYKGSVTLIR